MLSRFRLTRASSSVRWTNRMWITSKVFPRRFPSTRKGTSHNPRSTVGTVTEIYDYLRLLFARVGIPHCPVCGREVTRQSAQEIVDAIEELPDGTAC